MHTLDIVPFTELERYFDAIYESYERITKGKRYGCGRHPLILELIEPFDDVTEVDLRPKTNPDPDESSRGGHAVESSLHRMVKEFDKIYAQDV